MPNVSVLEVLLHNTPIATLTLLQGDRAIFAFNQSYIDDLERSTLSLSFYTGSGSLITETRPTQTVLPPFFSNLLPEGHMRSYLAEQAGVKEQREFYLLWVLGRDLPGAVTVRPADGEAWPPNARGEEPDAKEQKRREHVLRFSLAGVQLKFSAVKADGRGRGLTIPATGVGGSWIVKLPAANYSGVPENEFSMMTLAKSIGMNVPEVQLVDLESIEGLPKGIETIEGKAFVVRRFDRSAEGAIHIEDFAQVFGVFPGDKYDKGSYRSIAEVLGIAADDEDVAEFIKRLVFNTLIGNADMHLKNWSLIYPDGRNPHLSPAYDFVSTVPYIDDERAALKYARKKRMNELTADELRSLAGKARLSEKLVMDAAAETVERFKALWPSEKKNLPLTKKVQDAIETHMQTVPLYQEW
ncbi:type II toxin-antitoxin system HipA family toxin [Microvirga puerhi]|uniref:HipA domain-containing protein n=1 Tax=Microvirga puerhi TaxID=2876078 RepID=A0ABS7VUR1_9HYPH|nr:HipA domain-containing protein [Microvirga puerhi]MBZ6078909.1 HipA domain-containing protein [Microvirga puerhi]